MSKRDEEIVMVHCDQEHSWAVAVLPLEVTAFCNLLRRAKCPYCGSRTVFAGPSVEIRAQRLRDANDE